MFKDAGASQSRGFIALVRSYRVPNAKVSIEKIGHQYQDKFSRWYISLTNTLQIAQKVNKMAITTNDAHNNISLTAAAGFPLRSSLLAKQ